MPVTKRKCKHCKEYKLASEGIKVPAGWFCSRSHAIEFANKKVTKERKAQDKKKAQENKKAVRKLKDNDRSHQFRLTKQKIQHWVNHVRDKGKPCISCGTTNPNITYSGGHYRTAGGNPEIALEPLNIHRQCLFNCNKNKSGNTSGDKHSIGFKQGLIERYGEDLVNWLDGYHEPKNYTCEQLKKIRAFYSKLIRQENPDNSKFSEVNL